MRSTAGRQAGKKQEEDVKFVNEMEVNCQN